MQDLTITIVQSDLKWQDKSYNLAHLEELLAAQKIKTDAILLPEMFNTGFSMETGLLAEYMNGPGMQWLLRMAEKYITAVCGSLIINDNGKFVNRLIWMNPDGSYHTYDKHHLFGLLNEEKHYTPGNEHIIFEYKGWRIQPFVCYDLRFPAWCRNTMDADLQFWVANWPERRGEHWKLLLKARAVENQCYTAGVNRIGNDNNNIYHSGDSGIYSPSGTELVTVAHEEAVRTVTLNKHELMEYRRKMPFLQDRDTFNFQ